MPPALPADNTDRWFYDYSVGGFQHTMLVRTTGGQLAGDVIPHIDEFLTNLGAYLAEITTVGLRLAVQGSSVTNSVSTAGLNTTYGTGAQGAIYAPVQTTFTGRDVSGHKGRVGIFGAVTLNDSTYRITVAENTLIADAIGALEDAAVDGVFCSINANRLLWHQYANVGLNDHNVKALRGSS